MDSQETAMSEAGTVGAIMTRHVVKVSMDDSVRQVREVFESVKFHHLVVVENGRVVGVISDRDLLKHLSPFVGKATERAQDLSTLNKRVHQIMSRRLVSCTPETTLGDAGTVMLDQRVECLPVLNGAGECVGVITLRDMLGWALVQIAGREDSCPVKKAA